MDRSDVLTLVSRTNVKNSKGVVTATETYTLVYASVDSISASEFFEGSAQGLQPEYRFTLFAYDYDNQTTVKYNDVRYSVYRTYRTKNDMIELYVQKDIGS